MKAEAVESLDNLLGEKNMSSNDASERNHQKPGKS